MCVCLVGCGSDWLVSCTFSNGKHPVCHVGSSYSMSGPFHLVYAETHFQRVPQPNGRDLGPCLLYVALSAVLRWLTSACWGRFQRNYGNIPCIGRIKLYVYVQEYTGFSDGLLSRAQKMHYWKRTACKVKYLYKSFDIMRLSVTPMSEA